MAEDLLNVPYEAGWTPNLAHRPDPNRVSTLAVPSPGRFDPGPRSAAPVPADPTATLHVRPLPAADSPADHRDPQSNDAEPSYYDIPMLKKPVWKWQIATYFYLGGLSAGAYVLARAAERGGGDAYRDVARVGSYVALASLVPCPPLLIWDLGDPKRFHHMLRIWKPSSPMNFGTWAITAYGGAASAEALRQYLNEHDRHLTDQQRGGLTKLMNNGTVLLLHDLAGVPLAIAVAGYTGVLLSCTANPLWCKNPFLGPLFSASTVSTGAEAIGLALNCLSGDTDSLSQSYLRRMDTAAHAAELALMSGLMKFAGEKAQTLRTGPMSRHHKFSIAGMLAAEALKLLPAPRRLRRPLRLAASALGLAAGFSMRWAMVFGGQDAAADPHTARLVSRPREADKRTGGRMTGASGRLAHGS